MHKGYVTYAISVNFSVMQYVNNFSASLGLCLVCLWLINVAVRCRVKALPVLPVQIYFSLHRFFYVLLLLPLSWRMLQSKTVFSVCLCLPFILLLSFYDSLFSGKRWPTQFLLAHKYNFCLCHWVAVPSDWHQSVRGHHIPLRQRLRLRPLP